MMVAQDLCPTGYLFTVSGLLVPTTSAQQAPSRIGCEARPIAAGKLVEPRYNGSDAPVARIGQRPPAEGSESGPEDHRGVDQIGVLNDLLSKAGDAFVNHDQDQPVD